MEEAGMIRERAKLQRRGISSYMLNIVIRAVEFEERIMARGGAVTFNRTLYAATVRTPGPRTAILLRCSKNESERIRRASKIRDVTISGFVVHAIRSSWNVERNLIQPYFGR